MMKRKHKKKCTLLITNIISSFFDMEINSTMTLKYFKDGNHTHTYYVQLLSCTVIKIQFTETSKNCIIFIKLRTSLKLMS